MKKVNKTFSSIKAKRTYKKQILEYKENEDCNTISTEVFDCKYHPQKLKFRQQEEQEIQEFIKTDNEINFLMVTGQPGSGKTMMISKLKELWEKQYLVVYCNAMTCRNYIEYLQEICKIIKIKCPLTGKRNIKNIFKTEIVKIAKEQDIILIIDEFDNLFNNSDKDPFDLFILSQNKDIKIIGISNDIEFLQTQSAKFKFQLPELQNIILKPYTSKQMAELVRDRISNQFKVDDQAIQILTGKAYNDKGGDMRNVLDTCKKLFRNKYINQTITKDDYIEQVGQQQESLKIQKVVENLGLQTQIIILALFLSNEKELELPNLIRKVNEVKYKLGLSLTVDIDESLLFLVDYNFIQIKEQKLCKNGLRYSIKKVMSKLDNDEIKYYLQNVEVFKSILI